MLHRSTQAAPPMYCQKCHLPVKWSDSLDALDPAAFDILIASSSKCHPTLPASPGGKRQQDLRNTARTLPSSSAAVYRREIVHAQRESTTRFSSRRSTKDVPNMSFVMLTQSSSDINPSSGTRSLPYTAVPSVADHDMKSLIDHIERSVSLHETISARTDIDHPICVECADRVDNALQKQLLDVAKERDAYTSFLRNVNASIPAVDEFATAQQSLNMMLNQESDAAGRLMKLEAEKMVIDGEITSLGDKYEQLDKDEGCFWQERTDFTMTLGSFLSERDALNIKYDHDSRQLERLQRTNVYNDTFCISHDGYFGTINGLRLGRLGNPPVEWAEINAAWGQTLLLLSTVANKLGFQFAGYKLRPMGSVSKIEKIVYSQQGSNPPASGHDNPEVRLSPTVTSLDLFSSGDLPLNLPWLHRRFDAGMVAFLDCLRQLGVHVEQSVSNPPFSEPPNDVRPGTPFDLPNMPQSRAQPQASGGGLKLPYEIRKDRIGDASIKLGFNQNDESWTPNPNKKEKIRTPKPIPWLILFMGFPILPPVFGTPVVAAPSPKPVYTTSVAVLEATADDVVDIVAFVHQWCQVNDGKSRGKTPVAVYTNDLSNVRCRGQTSCGLGDGVWINGLRSNKRSRKSKKKNS
ncbi:predicted protein [Uncinocarpus reesii 1704]|uniref:Uncharacterized protein n=1 Tax=Uncinocarpus reesii (strain UAMH 1704) TaxID=336963 RepID=C4JIL5_UNCRE|nr:uncharacterized protein UREG_01552 [Uncinocarpus reesii 1704]EEP76703.1 predicted protein [Uncinocarpus reesii 1704]